MKDVLASEILSAKVIRDADSHAEHMDRDKLIATVKWIAVSHERLRAEFEALEELYANDCAGDEPCCECGFSDVVCAECGNQR